MVLCGGGAEELSTAIDVDVLMAEVSRCFFEICGDERAKLLSGVLIGTEVSEIT